MADKKVYHNFITPIGTASYPKLDVQDVYKGKEVGYKLNIYFDDKELAQVKAEITKAIELIFPKGMNNGSKTPIRKDKEGNEFITCKSYNKVPLFKAKGNEKFPKDTILGGGSKVRVKISMTEGNDHLVAYMNSIQVAVLVEKGADGFDDLDGYDNAPSEDFGDIEDDGGLDI